MSNSIKDTICKRRSIRTFDGRKITAEDRSKLEEIIRTADNPFGAPVEFKLLDAKENGLSSPVIVGCELYFAAKVKRIKRYEIALGYSFEKACLLAHTLGLGTVMLAASLNRSAFEKAMNVQADEVMPVASPVGYPANKKSIRESLMRKSLKADDRIPFDKLFFENDFGHSLSSGSTFYDALQMARLAPSAANKQPWRAVVIGNTVHFYEYKTMKEHPLIDIQKVDIGIALSHFDLTEKENGHSGRFTELDPQLALPDKTHYIISYERAE